jgi:hypothetical protein
MEVDDQGIDDWVRQLAGKTPAANLPAEVRALRGAIAASTQSDSDAAAADRAVRGRLVRRLEQLGLLSDASPT